VTLYFKSWPNADIVPAVRINDQAYFEIPNMNDGTWVRTEPKSHDLLMSGLHVRARQLVLLIKYWNRAHSGYIQSFHIEKVTLAMPDSWARTWNEDDWCWALCQFFEKAIEMTEAPKPISDEYESAEWLELRNRLMRGHGLAREAWSAIYHKNNVKFAVDRLKVLFDDSFPNYG
jgi:hypothetical protein